MISGRAGGHDFKDGHCECGAELVDLQWTDPKTDVGKSGIAHAGTVTFNECEQLAALGQKMRDHFSMAFGRS